MKIAYVGAYGTGKTTQLVAQYCAHKTAALITPGYWLVPTADHIEDTRHLLLKKYNPLCNDNILTISQLAQNITKLEPLTELKKQLLLRQATSTVSLRIFAKATVHHLFYQTVSSLIAECKHYGVTPQDLVSQNNSKLGEIAALYTAYENHKQTQHQYDSEDILTQSLDKEIAKQDFLILDGFNDLTPLQEKFITKLAHSTENIYASSTQPQLQNYLESLGCTIQELLEQKRCIQPETKLLVADNRYLELENIAREIIRLNNAGYAWGDCAIIFRQIHEYAELIQDVFTYYNIPVTIHTGIYVHHDRFVRKLLDILSKDSAYWTERTKPLHKMLKDYVQENNLLEQLALDVRIPELTQVIRYSLKAYQRLLTIVEALEDSGQLTLELLKESLTQDMLSLADKPQNHVQVYDALIARNKEHKAIFIANLTQGSFPIRISENSLCTDHERSQLSPRLRTTADKIKQEKELFIQATTRTTEKLYYSYALSEITGQALTPSHFIPQQELPTITRSISDTLPDIKNAVSTQELIDTLIFNLYKTYTHQDIEILLQSREDLQKIRGIIECKQDSARQTAYYEKAQTIIQNVQRISAKNIELFTACPFAFFSKVILKLKTEPEDQTPILVGEVIHKALELFREENGTKDITLIFTETYPDADWQKLFNHLHPKQQNLERERIVAILQKYTAWDLERMNTSHAKTTAREEKIEYKLGNTTLVGVIDRVDTLPDQTALIIDYKSGQLPPMSLKELAEGYIPQAWIYALLYQELKNIPVIGSEYQQVITTKTKGIYAETHTDLLGVTSRQILNTEAFTSALQQTKQKLIQVLQDIHQAKFYGFARHCENICEFSAVCRMNYERS